jgi:hypothetical protein
MLPDFHMYPRMLFKLLTAPFAPRVVKVMPDAVDEIRSLAAALDPAGGSAVTPKRGRPGQGEEVVRVYYCPVALTMVF